MKTHQDRLKVFLLNEVVLETILFVMVGTLYDIDQDSR